MISIPIARKDQTYDMFLVMTDESIERIKSYDPAEFEPLKLGHPWNTMKLNIIFLMYGTHSEIDDLMHCPRNDIMNKLKNLCRGWKFRPELGDNDGPYTSIKITEN